jgi:periplasmic protein TonB
VKQVGSGGARTFGLTAISLSAHLVAFTMLGLVPPPSDVLAMHEMEFTVEEPPPEPETPPPPPPPPDPPEPEPPKAKAPKAAAPEPEPPPEETPPPEQAPEEVADFTGTTLTAEGAGWSTRTGSGAPLTGPVGKIGRKPSDSDQMASKPVGPTGPRVVPLKSLSRRPAAPQGLDAMLERHYPKRARTQGVEGKVVIALRVLPTGRPADLRVVREHPSGFDFAEACRKTIRESGAFTPGLDRDGTAVASDIDFTCDFVVDY